MRHKSRSSKLTVPPREGVSHIERIGRKGGRDMIRAGPAAGGGSGKDPPQGGRTPQGGAYHHLDWLVFVATTSEPRARARRALARAPYVRKPMLLQNSQGNPGSPITTSKIYLQISFTASTILFFHRFNHCIVSLSNHRLHRHHVRV